jgi:hypothetical protein
MPRREVGSRRIRARDHSACWFFFFGKEKYVNKREPVYVGFCVRVCVCVRIKMIPQSVEAPGGFAQATRTALACRTKLFFLRIVMLVFFFGVM